MGSKWVDLRAVKQAVSLEAVLRRYQVQGIKPSGPQGHLRGRCPLHGDGGEDAFHVSLGKNAFRCFYCEAQGNVLDFVAGMERCSVREAALRLQEWFEIGHPPTATQAPEIKLVPKKERWNPPLTFRLRGVDAMHPYVTQRGIDRATANWFGVGFFPGHGLMARRIVIPIHDADGQLVAYCGRSLDGTAPRYKMPPGFRKSLVLFNLHRAAACGQTTVVIVEGFFDCMKVHQAGWRNVVALMGASLSSEQEELLLERFTRIVLILDGDTVGRAASAAIAARLAGKCSVRQIRLSDGLQPDELNAKEAQKLLEGIEKTCQT
jgi:DNA primase